MNTTLINQFSDRAIASASLILALASAASATIPVFSNGSDNPFEPGLATGAFTASGIAAPQGSSWSEVPHVSLIAANAISGFACHDATSGTGGTEAPFHFADDFVVPAGASWQLQSVSFFVYQAGNVQLAPYSAVNLRLWQGRPGDIGAVAIGGDMATNVLTSQVSTNILRIFNTVVAPSPAQPNANRIIWKVDAALPNLTLTPGTYWLQWQIESANPAAEVFCPPVVVPSARGKANANARQLRTDALSTGGTWTNIIDFGKPSAAGDVAQDMPFILYAGGTVGCTGDLVGGDGNPPGDGTVDGNDFTAFLNAFAAAESLADIVGGDGNPPADGSVDGNDFSAFLNFFGAGC